MVHLPGQIIRHLRRNTGVSLRWLTRMSSRLDRTFQASASVVRRPGTDGLDEVVINGTPFIWPAPSPLKGLVMTAAELMLPQHPHQYLWEGTQIERGDVVIDVGCCEGSFAAKAGELGASVVAVEPSRVMQLVITRLFELRKLPLPVIAPIALGAAGETEISFTDNITNPGASCIGNSADAPTDQTAETYPVRLITLDAMVAELGLHKVDFIKCDAEGFDLDVLRGSMQTIRRHKPKLAFCTYHKSDHFAEMKKLLADCGYTLRGKGLFNTAGEFNVMMLHAWPK